MSHLEDSPSVSQIDSRSVSSYSTALSDHEEPKVWNDSDSGNSRGEGRLPKIHPTEFPGMPSSDYPACLDTTLSLHITTRVRLNEQQAWHRLLLAWGLVLKSHADESQVIFGVNPTPQTASKAKYSLTNRSCEPLTLDFDVTEMTSSLLQAISPQVSENKKPDTTSFQNPRYHSSFIYFPSPSDLETLATQIVTNPVLGSEFSPITIICTCGSDTVDLLVIYDSLIVGANVLSSLLRHFRNVSEQILVIDETQTIDDISLAGPEDLQCAIQWAGTVPKGVDETLHGLVCKQAKSQPNAQALASWDIDMSYAELDLYSSHLALHLHELGVKPGDFIPTCFEQSGWVPVVYLAILKAGGAFAPIDYGFPQDRIDTLLENLRPNVILSCLQHQEKFANRARHVLTISGEDFPPSSTLLNVVAPVVTSDIDDPAYVITTSGSTGKPKQIVITHGSICSSTIYQGRALGYSNRTRAFQFASYVFDVSIGEIFFTLAHGGVICTPSEQERRNDIVGAFQRLKPDRASLTPTLAEFFTPDKLPTLTTLMIGGEAMTSENVATWASKVRLINGYGPAEAAVLMACTPQVTPQTAQGNFGYPHGCAAWLVDPQDPNELVPVGCTGELLIEGPQVGKGYLNDPEKTAAAFIERPRGLPPSPFAPGSRETRCYLTGDICRFDPTDGSIQFVRRKDASGKVVGQRLEFKEIESYIRGSSSSVKCSMAATPKLGLCKNHLVALVGFEGTSADYRMSSTIQIIDKEKSQQFLPTISSIRNQMSRVLPQYMIPSIWFAVVDIPLSVSGKLNRTLVTKWLETLDVVSFQERMEIGGVTGQGDSSTFSTVPQTAREAELQQIIGEILHIPADRVALNHTFITLGGDSFSAMRVTSTCAKRGLRILVENILAHKTISELAVEVTALDKSQDQSDNDKAFGRFPLLKLDDPKALALEAELTRLLGSCDSSVVEDLYPCSAVQEGVLVSQMKGAAAYNILAVWEITSAAGTGPVTKEDLRRAWASVVERHAPLRTTYLESMRDGGLFDQVVLRHPKVEIIDGSYESSEVLEDLVRHTTRNWKSGDIQHKIGFAKTEDGRIICHVLMNHAFIDGISMSILHRDLKRALNGQVHSTPKPDYKRYVSYLQDVQNPSELDYWRTYLSDMDGCLLPTLSDVPHSSRRYLTKYKTVPDLARLRSFCRSQGVTLFNLLQAAWALTLRAYTFSDDVCFAFMSSEQHIMGDQAEDAVGLFINLLLCRVSMRGTDSITDLLRRLQKDFVASLPYSHVSLAEITHTLNAASDGLFNTAMTLFKENQVIANTENEIGLHQIMIEDVTEYDVVVKIMDSDADMAFEFCYWNSLLSDDQAENVFDAFLSAVSSLSQEAVEEVNDVQLLDEMAMTKVFQWNSDMPEEVDICVHNLLAESFSTYSSAQAVESQDGNLTYQQLDDLSNKLASHLIELGVGPEVSVALNFEKSCWAVVAEVAVVRAGGAFLPLDPSHPLDRRLYIVDDVGPKVLLTNKQVEHSLAAKIDHILYLSQQFIEDLPSHIPVSTGVSPSNAAYIIYTSGSTGMPKGVVIEHRNISSSIKAHASAVLLDHTSRVLQFASYSWDVSVCEILTTLVQGGCVCIVAENDRLNDLPKAMNDMNVTYAVFTPTILHTLRPHECPTVKTIMFGGEAPSPSILATWGPHVTLVQAYGPAEASIIATIAYSSTPAIRPSIIGRGIGSRTWISNPDNINQLMPIGAIGELLIEGPTIAREYLHNPEKTNASFLEKVPWVADSGYRAYRTGDLVRFSGDGSIEYIGRNDGQVKVRGQRTELGEIEHHLVTIDSNVKHCVVTLPKEGPFASRVVATISFQDTSGDRTDEIELLNEEQRHSVKPLLAKLRDTLSDRVPGFMVPRVWIAVSSMPMSVALKVDRRRVLNWLVNLNEATFHDILDLNTEEKATDVVLSPLESRLRAVWSHVLNLPESQISLTRPFISLGGDSISAMQVVSKARSEGIFITVQDIFRAKTIVALAVSAQNSSIVQTEDSVVEMIDQDFKLSPIQKMHFDMYPHGINYFNQGCVLQISQSKSVVPQMVSDAAQQLVKKHSMLRARYRKRDGSWVQRITDDITGSLRYRQFEVTSTADVNAIIQSSQECFDIQNGPLFAVDFIQAPDRQLLFMAAHHLIIDLVSWRVLLDDLENLLASCSALSPAPLSFQTWVGLQNTHAQLSLPFDSVLPFRIPEAQIDYWGLSREKNTFEAANEQIFELDQKVTRALLGDSNLALQTDPGDLLMTAALQSFNETFTDRVAPTIYVEGHGRETWTNQIDISQTVGWFTTVTPVTVDAQRDIIETLKRTKDARRAVPGKGLPYFSCRYLTEEGSKAFKSHSDMEICLNYFGQYQQLSRDNAILRPAPVGEFPLQNVSPSARRPAIFEITAAVNNGRFTICLIWPRGIRHGNKVSRWVDRLKRELISIAEATIRLSPSFTLADFSLAQISYVDLLEIEKICKEEIGTWGPETIEEVFPCSPMQQGILLSQSRSSALYDVRLAMEVTTNARSSAEFVSLDRLKKAWLQVVRRHSILRTVFIQNSRGGGAYDQVVLKNPTVPITEIEIDAPRTSEEVAESLREATGPSYKDGSIPHEFTVCRSGDRVFAQLRISHALIDGVSLPIVMRDLALAYDSRIPRGEARPYRDLIAFLKTKPRDEMLQYRSNYLKDIVPCHFPDLSDGGDTGLRVREIEVPNAESLRSFCKNNGFTVSNLFHAAWALVLRAYTGDDQVSFGYLTSGRDNPMESVSEIVGPFINMLICRVNFADSRTSGLELIRNLHDDFLEGLANQYISLADVQHTLGHGSEPLFNTLLSLQKTDVSATPMATSTVEQSEIKLTPIDGKDPTEYDITLHIVDAEKLSFTFSYWSDKICDNSATQVIRTLLTALSSLESSSTQNAASLNLIHDESREELEALNAACMPIQVTTPLHKLIENRVQDIPTNQAVHSWDKDLTYQELDEYANALAHHLRSFGVGPEVFVVTCFDKSAWAVVAQVATLKAGGAFASVDPSHPMDRIMSIIGDLMTTVALVGANYEEKLKGLVTNIVPVSEGFLLTLPRQISPPNVTVTARNVAYSVFTSGSTGKPKGIIVEHGCIATAASRAHVQQFRLGRHNRVLHFAAYTFDISVAEIFHTLVNGGCICIPTEWQRLNDLAGAINSMQANWLVLTPTLADMLDPATVPSLETLIVMGEVLTPETIRRWSDKLFLINSYGPSECTVLCTANTKVSHTTNPANIGSAMGAGLWVADARNPNILLPVGCVGELFIQGPLVTRGYVNDAEKTAAAFIDGPAWVPEVGGKRLYRTGDIVRFKPDGSLFFVRRKDDQVKVRGQRVQLSEIEGHLSKADADVMRAIALLPKAGACKNRLTAVLSYRNVKSDSEGLASYSNEITSAKNAAIREYTASKVPTYMVPKIWIILNKLPSNSNGKIDRRQVMTWVEALDQESLDHIVRESSFDKTGPQSPVEAELQQLWGQVLNIPAITMPTDQTFISLGGDSISAMQVATRSRSKGIVVTVQDVLRCKSLIDLARQAQIKADASIVRDIETEITQEPFPLLPIQRMFFSQMPDGENHYNQSFLVRLSKHFSTATLLNALTTIVRQHHMLRARFSFDGSEWMQTISRDIEASFSFKQYTAPSVEAAIQHMNETEASLDLKKGPLFVVDLIDTPDTQVLFLVAHHLVVDLVSWRVILEDLEHLLAGQTTVPKETLPLPVWTKVLTDQATKYNVNSVLPYSIPSADFTYWGMENTSNLVAEKVIIETRVDATTTKSLLGQSNTPLQTDPVDLMVSALVFSFAHIFAGRAVPAIYTESHGRKAWDDSIDISRTVGWLTTICPLAFKSVPHDPIEMIVQTKELRRSIPGNGLPYFTSRFLTEEGREAFGDHASVEILFNYVGQYQQLQQSDRILQELPNIEYSPEDSRPANPRLALLDVAVLIRNGEMVLAFAYNKKMNHATEIQSWLQAFCSTLIMFSERLSTMEKRFTPSDFPLLHLTEEGFRTFGKNARAQLGTWHPDEIETAYPCSPMQQGMLLSQSKDTNAYNMFGTWEVLPPEGERVDINQLEMSWTAVVQHHPILRTIFVESSRKDGIFDQVVLRNAVTRVEKVSETEGSNHDQYFRSRSANIGIQHSGGKPPHVLTIYTTNDDRVYIHIQLSHAIIDGTSFGILQRDLQSAYSGTLRSIGPVYSDYISYIHSQPVEKSLGFWKDYLEDARPTYFPNLANDSVRELKKITAPIPNLSDLRELCRVHGISILNIFQLAWSLVLRSFTYSDNVSFGYLTSGRDIPIDDIEDAIGPFINMLICHTTLEEHHSALDVLKGLNSQFIDSLPYQHFSLADIQHELGIGSKGLFNTVMSLQKTVAATEASAKKIRFEALEGHDPNEYNITLNVVDGGKGLDFYITYWTDSISDVQAADVVTMVVRSLSSIAKNPEQKLFAFDLMTDLSREQIYRWNSHRQEPIEACIHNLMTRHVPRSPDKQALVSWEGQLTYREMDEFSSRLARHLRTLGVGLEVPVLVCSRKSIWAVVAMLSVLKAGGAIVPLDPSHPRDRIRHILHQIESKVAIASPEEAHLLEGMVNVVVPIDGTRCKQLPDNSHITLPNVTPDNMAYIIFTSGSTGIPKGVVIEHRAISTSSSIHGPIMNFGEGTRVLQFSSYSFDVCIGEIFTSLVHGGTLCIPSDNERMNDITGAINRMDANWAFLTPSVANMIRPSDVPGLKTLTVGGEPLFHTLVETWKAGSGKFIQTYGPAECSVFATWDERSEKLIRPESLGTAMGCTTWIVNPSDPNILMPVGSVGELVLQGPILGRGYLKDPVKTSGAFLRGLKWMTGDLEGERVYRTGDLVRYGVDGSLNFVKRKDTQVKVRGQRVELGEIDYQVGASHPDIQRRKLILGSSGRFKGKIIVVIAFKDIGGDKNNNSNMLRLLDGQDRVVGERKISEMRNYVSDKLPSYMIPAVWIPVSSIPITTSDKIDGRKIEAWLGSMDDNAVDNIMNLENDEDSKPSSEIEASIQRAFSEVINLPVRHIPMTRSFISLGGDSITAMQVMAVCRRQGISLAVQHVLKSQNIPEMARKAKYLTKSVVNDASTFKEQENVPFDLSPIQRLHFDQFPNGENHYNQSVLLQLNQQFSRSQLAEALETLIQRHSMLRARYQKGPEGRWSQTISSRVKESYSLVTLKLNSWTEAMPFLEEAEQSLDIVIGPLFAARYVECPERNILLLVAHHLIIDFVSWRVLLREFEQLLETNRLSDELPLSFQNWVNVLSKHSQSNTATATLPFSVPVPDLAYWGMDEKRNDFSRVIQGSFTLDAHSTKLLLGDANDNLRTEPLDSLLAMAAHTFQCIFIDRDMPTIFTESHGRQDPSGEVQPLETVGWFTSIAPYVLPRGTNLVDSVRRAKDTRRAVIGNGTPYFTNKYLSERTEELPRNSTMEILFNYIGQFQQFEREDALFKLLPKDMGPGDVNLAAPRLALIDLSAVVEQGNLTVSWAYHQDMRNKENIEQWMMAYERSLVEVSNQLKNASPQFTLSDLPLLPTSYENLDMLNEKLASITPKGVALVESVYPISPMQRGILMSQSKDASHYDVRVTWEVKSTSGQEVDILKLQRAWNQVVERHSILRTVFIRSIQADAFFDQVVIRRFRPPIVHYEYDEESVVLQQLWEEGRIDYTAEAPAHCLTLCSKPGKKVFAHLQISHALIDGTSRAVLLKDWALAYEDKLDVEAGLHYQDYIAYIQSIPHDTSVDFWLTRLEGLKPSILPSLTDGVRQNKVLKELEVVIPFSKELRATSKSLGVSVANIFQLAWALVLSIYTKSNDVCFGYLTAGRDIEIDGIQDAVGPFINVLVSRVVFDDNSTVSTALNQLFSDYIESLSHQHVSLADIKHALKFGGEQIFNTVVSFQKISSLSSTKQPAIGFEVVDGRDPSEYDFAVNIIESNMEIGVSLTYWTSRVSDGQASNLADSLLHALKNIKTPEQSINAIDLLPDSHKKQITAWNQYNPDYVDRCIHDVISEVSKKNPDAAAIRAWDRDFTYGELDRESSRLAHFLIERGVVQESWVAVCFEKSAWTVVAILAILKAGGGFLLLDPTAPVERIGKMVDAVQASILLCSAETQSVAERLNLETIVVNEQAIMQLALPAKELPRTLSSNAAYIIFTSGTTGTPKGTIIEHKSCCTSSAAQARMMAMRPSSRCLQFASYTFDACIGEIVTPLTVGACVCIPHDDDRTTNLPRVIAAMEINWALLTSSFLKTITPDSVPGLKTIVQGGEPLVQRDIDTWAKRVHFMNGYGPSECTVLASLNCNLTPESEPSNIGRPCGCSHWVVDPDTVDQLMPIGCVGELIIEGPTVSRGYINDATKTAAAFIQSPSWAKHIGRDYSRFYRTGDLVRMNSNGTLTYIGRQDNQVKVRGQRVELGDIEHNLFSIEDINHCLVMYPTEGPFQKRLVVVLSLKDFAPISTLDQLRIVGEQFRGEAGRRVISIRDNLSKKIPKHMVPDTWIVVENIPFMLSGKLHRSMVKGWLETLDKNDSRMVLGSTSLVDKLEHHERIALQVSEKLSDIIDTADDDTRGHNCIPVQAGLDSIAVISLSNWILQTFGTSIPLSTLLSFRITVRDIASLINAQASKANSPEQTQQVQSRLTNKVDLASDFKELDQRLAHVPISRETGPSTSNAPKNFLVTGATGFLGNQILKRLLDRLEIEKIICLVRANSDDHAKQRIIHAASQGKWWAPKYEDRLEFWSGDLAEPHLGLNEERWMRISGIVEETQQIDAIIHNGAVVHWQADYHDLRDANIISTVDLLSALSTAPVPPRLSFVSGGYFADAQQTDEEVLDLLHESGGYSQSKFVSELLVKSHGQRIAQLRPEASAASIIKPGMIIGEASHGVSNVDDYLWRVIASAIKIKAYNCDEANHPDAWLLLSGSDLIADKAIEACFKQTKESQVIRFVDGIPTKDIWNILRDEYGYSLQPMAAGDWLKELEKDVEREGRQHPLLPVLGFLKLNNGALGMFKPKSGVPQASREQILLRIRRSIEYLQEAGFFVEQKGQNNAGAFKPAFKRSGLRSAKNIQP